ncbi:MAG TPA: lipoprotein [Rhodanobacteraceae bacterium]
MPGRFAVAPAALLLAACALSGCGQKGPLTLPPKAGTVVPAAAKHHHRQHRSMTPTATPPAAAPGTAASTAAPATAATTGI